MRTLRLLLLALVLVAAAPGDLVPYLVKDINPETTGSNAALESFVALGDLALFWVWRPTSYELWRTDGTASGTYRLADTEYSEILATTGDLCFFRFQGADNRWYLWVTDGTLPGTFSLGETGGYSEVGHAAWVARQGVLYFAAEIPGQEHGTELWRSDGTPGGTSEVADIWPGPGSSNPASLTSFQGRLYFSASDPVHGSALWQSDGTAQGTVPVREVPVTSIYAVGPRLVFLGTDPAHGLEPWASDGTTAGTRRIADLTKGSGSPDYHDFEVVGQRLFFTAMASAAQGQELYVTNGTAQGTRQLTSFSNPDAVGWLQPVALGNRLFFSASNRTSGLELWSSDGTAKGTRMVLDACPGDCWSDPAPLFRHQGRLYYQATDGTHGSELWVTDGTAQGTRMLKDICPGECSSWPRVLSASGGRPFFTTGDWDGLAEALWTTDGTQEGTVALPGGGGYMQGVTAGGKLFFSGTHPDFGSELWCSGGTPEGTHFLVDVAYDIGGSEPRNLMTLGGALLFGADGADGAGLWRSDGTDAGTVVVKAHLSVKGPSTASASRVFFQANGSRTSFELWTSDGTEAGTVRLTQDGVLSLGELSQPVIKLGSRVFFSAWDMEHGSEPWITDGTQAGTRLVADLRPGPAHSSPRDFTVFAGRALIVAHSRLWKSDGTAEGTFALGPQGLRDIQPRTTFGGRLWFTGRNNRGRTELWATDGTAARTVRIADLRTVEHLTVHAGRLWLVGDGTELWSLDGTAAGTRKLDLRPSVISGLASDGLRLYLTDSQNRLWVSDGTTAGTRKISDQGVAISSITLAGRLFYISPSWELYTSDGTEAGTRPVRPGDGPKQVTLLLRFGNRLVLRTSYGALWQSDGTAAGTAPVPNLGPDRYPGTEIVKAGPRLFFSAWDKEIGWELWAMRE